ncbi:MAG: GAF domain-containing protein [Cyanobacteria bacterium]|nr:GAF domain-containing protein [Cyanobacteriota bacterium]MDW8199909.1 adenylate/guanylate cyclase domain-containing protein [Cyanobacteriota bacterium SKYGB_h_bin112]
MPYLIHQPDTAEQVVWKLNPGVNTIGRGQGSYVLIADAEKGLSRLHAEITLDQDVATLVDCNSRNGTFIGDHRITKHQLRDGDVIRMANAVFKFVNHLDTPSTDTLTGVKLPAQELTILGRISPDKTRIEMQELLDSEQTASNRAGLRLRQQDDAKRTADKLKILLEVSKQLSSPDSADVLLERLLNLVFQIMAIDRAAILMLNETTGQMEQRATKARPGIYVDAHFYSTRIINYVCTHSEAILTNDASVDSRFESSDSILFQTIQACMCAPLKPRDTVIGVMYVDNVSMSNTYSEEDLEFLTALANQAAIALENANLIKKMQAEAVIRAKLERFFPAAVTRKIEEEGDLKIVETEVTALFSDISGFTAMSSQMEPRQVLEMLNDYFKVMVEDIVFRYEGTLEKYIADALLAVWGAPYRKIDDAARAVWAAIEMQWAARNLSQQWKKQRNLEIHIHIGLNTGRVAAGNIGSQNLIQYATIGDAMNIASRICSVAQADEIVISQATLDQIGETTFPVEKMLPVTVKGKNEPLQLYKVLWEQVIVWDRMKSTLSDL